MNVHDRDIKLSLQLAHERNVFGFQKAKDAIPPTTYTIFSNRAMALLKTEDQETFSSEMLHMTKYYQQHTGTLMKSNPFIFFLKEPL